MDAKDRKILSVLDRNSRASFSQIAKATRTSQETVRYRINRLLQEHVITHALAIINGTKLGFSYHQILVKLHNIDSKKRATVIDFLAKHEHVNWIGDLDGSYDIAFITLTKSQGELQQFIDEFYKACSQYIMKKNVSVHLHGEFFARDYLTDTKREANNKAIRYEYDEQRELTEQESSVVKMLAKNSRASAVEIAQEMNISADTVLNVIRRLEKDNVILGYGVILDLEQIGLLHYKLLLSLTVVDNENVQHLLTHCRLTNRVIAIVKTLGSWDYEVDIEVENVQQLKAFTMELTNRYSSVIRDYEVLRITDMPKYTFYS